VPKRRNPAPAHAQLALALQSSSALRSSPLNWVASTFLAARQRHSYFLSMNSPHPFHETTLFEFSRRLHFTFGLSTHISAASEQARLILISIPASFQLRLHFYQHTAKRGAYLRASTPLHPHLIHGRSLIISFHVLLYQHHPEFVFCGGTQVSWIRHGLR